MAARWLPAHTAPFKRKEHKMPLKPAGFAPHSAEDNNLDTDKAVL